MDPEAREALVLANRPLVLHIVERLAIPDGPGWERDDLISWGTIGLIQAVDRYDPARGRFSTFAAVRIQGAIRDALRALDPAPRGARATAPDDPRFAAPLPLAALAEGQEPTEDGAEPRDVIAVARLRAALGDLPERERWVLALGYAGGWGDEQIGRALGVSTSRAVQIRQRALGRLRAALNPTRTEGTDDGGTTGCVGDAARRPRRRRPVRAGAGH